PCVTNRSCRATSSRNGCKRRPKRCELPCSAFAPRSKRVSARAWRLMDRRSTCRDRQPWRSVTRTLPLVRNMMSDIDSLVQRYLEDRLCLSARELDELIAALKADADFAAKVREQ